MPVCSTANAYIARAIELRQAFALDAVRRDRVGGRPDEQIRLLKQSGLLHAMVPEVFGGGGQPYSTGFRIVREFAKTDGSLAHLFGYHFGLVGTAESFGASDKAADIYRQSVAGNWFWGNSANNFSRSLFGRRDGDDHVLNGFRPFSSGSHVADYLIIGWEDEGDGTRYHAAIPADREGLRMEDDWDALGQRQTGSGRVSFDNVRVFADEILLPVGPSNPSRTLTAQFQQAVLLNVYVGSAQGALAEARDYTLQTSRPWVHSDVERHSDDPWIKRKYGEFQIEITAAELLADRVGGLFDAVRARGEDLNDEDRGHLAVEVAGANVFAAKMALKVTSEIFEVMGARSAMNVNGFDRFWRNVRIHTLHDPAEYKTRNIGHWVLTGQPPAPSPFQ